MIANLLTRTATIHHRAQTGAVDRYNEPTWVQTETTAACYIEPLSADELTVGRETQVGTHRAVFPAGTDIDGDDEFTVDGTRYRVVGPPGRFVDPLGLGAVDHIDLRAEEVTL